MSSINATYENAILLLIEEYIKLTNEDSDNELLKFIQVKGNKFRYVTEELKEFLSKFSKGDKEPELAILTRYILGLKKANELESSKFKATSGLELRL